MSDIVKIDGVTRILDWRPSTHQKQNLKFRLMGLDCYTSGKKLANIKRKMTLNLDQGVEGACTGFGTGHALAATPNAVTTMSNDLARKIYYQARREDEWAGEDYDGSSVNGAMHAARTLGYITGWRWATTPAELQHGLSYHGAAVAGSAWRSGMWEPDSSGFLNTTGEDIGGHAYEVSGYRAAPSRGMSAIDYWIDNSWGPRWGLDGGCWIRDVDAHQLWFSGWGEIAIPIKKSV